MTFKDLNLNHFLLRAIEETGYENPTPIQQQAIPHALNGKDVLGLAQTGTGKTASFALPILQKLYMQRVTDKVRPIRALIVTPTRELAIQIQENFEEYGKHLPLSSTVIFGGVKQGNQVRELRKGVDVLIATPGRLLDLIQQGYISLQDVNTFVLDEADRMLDMGFIHDIKKLLALLPKKKQTMLFSATMPKEVNEIVDSLLVDPVRVQVSPVTQTVDKIEQYVAYVDNANKVNYLVDYIHETTQQSILLFTRTKRGSDKVVKDLNKRGISAQAIHGNKSQMARQLALENFKNYEIQVLVATDIASRGIDINELGYVVNYDIPEVPETYVHRIGRTGRAGQSGVAVSLVSFNDIDDFKNIEKHIDKKIPVLKNEKYPLVDRSPKPKPGQRNGQGVRKREEKSPRLVARKAETKAMKQSRAIESRLFSDPNVNLEKASTQKKSKKNYKVKALRDKKDNFKGHDWAPSEKKKKEWKPFKETFNTSTKKPSTRPSRGKK